MYTYEEIVNIVSTNNNKLRFSDIDLIAKYFMSLIDLNIISTKEDIDRLITKTKDLDAVIYYDNNDEELLKRLDISKKNKGLRSDDNRIIYICENLDDELLEITFYHEFTHFLQTFENNGHVASNTGVMQGFKWRLPMEAQTQNIAEMVYNHIHNIKPKSFVIPSEELRMLKGGIITSSLHNYEMYDYLFRKILLVLDITMEDFIKINFMGEEALEVFEDIITKKYGREVTDCFLEVLDLIYTTDVCIYGDRVTPEELMVKEFKTESLMDDRVINISLPNQFKKMREIDKLLQILTKDRSDIQEVLAANQFYLKDYQKYMDMMYQEQLYSTHYENGVETIGSR